MRTTTILLITFLLTACNSTAQNLSRYLWYDNGTLKVDTNKLGAFANLATQGFVAQYVGTHGGAGGAISSYTSNNGITLTNGNFALGGGLLQNTLFTGVFNVGFGSSASRLSQFNAYTTNGVMIQDGAVSGTYPTLQLSGGNYQLYGRSGTILSTLNLSITSGGVTSLTGEGLVINPTDSVNINPASMPVFSDTNNYKPLVIGRQGRIGQGYFAGSNPITSVFGRQGAVTAQAGDYSSFYPQLSGSYANPAWIASLPVSKITFAGNSGQQLLGDGSLATKITDNSQLANGANYLTNITGKITAGTNVVISGSGTTASPYVISSGGSSGAAWGTISGTLSSQTDLNTALSGKEPSITSGTTAQYWRGDKTFQTLNTTAVTEGTNLYYTDARARASITLTTTGTSGAATYSNGVLNIPNYATGSGVALTNFSAVAPLTYNNTTGVYSTSMNTSKLIGRSSAGVGVMEEITIGGGLNLAAGTLSNANSFSTGLTNTSNTITNNLSTGVSGGQSVIGGTASGNNLTLSSTTNATKGKLLFGTSGYDEGNNRLGIGTTSPVESIQTTGAILIGDATTTTNGTIRYNGSSVDARIGGNWLSMTNPIQSQLPTNIVYNNQANNFNGNTIENYSAKYNDQTGNVYTLLASDNGKVVTFSNATAVTVTVPSGLGVGFNCMIVQKGLGQVTISPSSTTINNRLGYTKTAGQFAVASLIEISSNVLVSGGDMSN